MNKLKNKKRQLRFPKFKKDWEVKELGEIGTFFSGGTPLTTKKEFYNGNIPFIKSGEINSDKTEQFITEAGLKNSSAKIVNKGDILYALYGATSGEVAIAKLEGAINQAVLCMRSDTNHFFIYSYLLKEKESILNKYLQGGQGNLSANIIKSIQISIPSVEEQEKIAGFLSAIDDKIDNLQQQLEKMKSYKKGIMQGLFYTDSDEKIGGGKSLIFNRLRFKDKSGKNYPDWETKTLGEISNKVMYGMNSSAIQFDGINKYIRITDIDEDTRQFLAKPLTSPDGEIEEKYKLKEGDILFARTGASVGKSYLYKTSDGNLLFAGFLIKFSIENNNPYFVFLHTFREEYNKWVQTMSMRSGQPGINAEEYKSLPIKLPCLEEQNKIATFLSSIDEKINTVNQQIEKSTTWKKGLLQKMFV